MQRNAIYLHDKGIRLESLDDCTFVLAMQMFDTVVRGSTPLCF